jgi:hypothetical protein
MGNHGRGTGVGPEDLRTRLRERLSALKGELQRLRFETDRRWDELLTRLTDQPEEIVPEELLRDASRSGNPAAFAGALSPETARRLDSAGNQVEALTRFLEECGKYAARAALLVERRGRLEVWKSTGFRDGDPRGRGIALDGSSILGRLRDGLPQRLAAGNELSAALGAGDASDAVLVPFVVREKVSGAVYADAAGDRSSLDADAVALATWIAGLVVDRLARRKLVPSPALRGFESNGRTQSAAPETPPSFASTPPPEEPAAPMPRDTGIPPPAPAASRASGETERPLGGPLAPPPENERRDEARRFARLLASEIKLYNEGEVREGRQRGDLYARLRADIERGRRLYEERVPADVRSGADYYYEELVAVLAGGRPEVLG